MTSSKGVPEEPLVSVSNHQPCPNCGSSDALTINADGSTKCYSCSKFTPGSQRELAVSKGLSRVMLSPDCDTPDLSSRSLKKETLRQFGYFVSTNKYGARVQVAPYYLDGELVAQHLRGADKRFSWLGNTGKLELFGQHRCRGRGPLLVITEGEIDAMSVAQGFPGTDVVSLPNGADSAARYVGMNLEFIEGYAEVVLMFDNDAPGQKAIDEAAALLTPGKAKVVGYPADVKDANDLLKANRTKELRELIYHAQVYRPDGVVAGAGISLADLMKPIACGIPYQFPKLEQRTQGGRKAEITIWTAGSGIGKSTLTRQLAYCYRQRGLRIGMVYLEENIKKTAVGFIALDNNVPLFRLRSNPKCIPESAFRASYDKLLCGDGLFFYDHFGSLDAKNLMGKLRYMAVSLKLDFIFLDHISIVVSGTETDNERKDIDILMTNLRSLAEATGVGIHAVVHLKRVKDKSFNDGGQVTLADLRGSGSLEQLSDNVIALERNQQAEGVDKDRSKLRVLKCRETGDTGEADALFYNRETGWLLPEDEAGVSGGFKDEPMGVMYNEKDEDF